MIQKQPPRGVPRKMFPENMKQIYREHPCRDVISIKLQSNFIEVALRHGCSTVNLLHVSRTAFPRNTSGLLFFAPIYLSEATYMISSFNLMTE